MKKAYHVPVMLDKCLEMLNIKSDGVYIDATAGGGGHSAAIMERQLDLGGKGMLVCIDRDAEALEECRTKLKTIEASQIYILVKGDFREICRICSDNGIDRCDGILFDLGASSHQFDEAARGFSYNTEAPLDMRMDEESDVTAYMIVNGYSEEELTRIIRIYGEENWAARIAEFIIKKRMTEKIMTTTQLVEVIKAAIPAGARITGPHPAKRTFQALRIAVNDELDAIKEALESSIGLLRPSGRLCVISYHSLEDRIVKNTFRDNAKDCICPKEIPICVCNHKSQGIEISRKPIIPSKEEIAGNHRARSAKLRVFEKR